MKKLLISTLILSASCAAPVKQADSALAEKGKSFKKSVEAVGIQSVRSEPCQRYSSPDKISGTWNWKSAVDLTNSCVRAKDFDKVEKLAHELSKREPSAPWGPYFLALVALERKQLERALWMNELSMRRAPEIGMIHYQRGQILWENENYASAVQSFDQAVQKDKTLTGAHLFLGQIFFRDQEYDRASKHFYEVLKADGQNSVALQGLAESQLRDNNPQGALDAYNRLASRYPNEGQYVQRMAEIYEGVLQKPSEALRSYRQLKSMMASGKVARNFNPDIDSKIKSLENSLEKRTPASDLKKGRK